MSHRTVLTPAYLIVQASLPTPATAKARQNLLDTISYVVASYGPQFRLALFGSAAIGGDREESDMDLCIVVRASSTVQLPSPNKSQTDSLDDILLVAGLEQPRGLHALQRSSQVNGSDLQPAQPGEPTRESGLGRRRGHPLGEDPHRFVSS